jgi:outer membrane protein
MRSKIKIIVLLLLSGLIIHFSGFSQEPWSLEQCIMYAYENNIQIKQQKLNTEYSQNNLQQSKMETLPNLSTNGSYGITFGRGVDPITYEFYNQTAKTGNMGINSNITLFSGLQKLNAIRQNEFNLQVSLQDLEKLKNDITLNIAAGYLQILFNTELLEVAKNQLNITSLQVDRTKILVDAGSLAKGGLLEIQSQHAAEELQVVNADNNLVLSYLNLAQLLDLDTVDNFRILIPELSQVEENELLFGVDSIYSVAVSFLPIIKTAEYKLSAAESGLSVAKGSRSPKLGLSASYGSGYSNIRTKIDGGTYPVDEQLRDNASSSLFFTLSVPIFMNYQIRNGIKNSKINVANSELELSYAKNLLFKEIQQSYADALGALKKYRATEKALVAMEESFKYTQEKFQVGLVNAVDFNVAKNQLTRTQSDLLQAKYSYIFKTSILNFYRGEPIKL